MGYYELSPILNGAQMKLKLEEQAALVRKLKGAEANAKQTGIVLTPEEALNKALGLSKLAKKRRKKKGKKKGGSMFLPGSFESNSR